MVPVERDAEETPEKMAARNSFRALFLSHGRFSLDRSCHARRTKRKSGHDQWSLMQATIQKKIKEHN